MPVKHAKETARRQMLDKTDGIIIVRVSVRNPELTAKQLRGECSLISEGEADSGR